MLFFIVFFFCLGGGVGFVFSCFFLNWYPYAKNMTLKLMRLWDFHLKPSKTGVDQQIQPLRSGRRRRSPGGSAWARWRASTSSAPRSLRNLRTWPVSWAGLVLGGTGFAFLRFGLSKGRRALRFREFWGPNSVQRIFSESRRPGSRVRVSKPRTWVR